MNIFTIYSNYSPKKISGFHRNTTLFPRCDFIRFEACTTYRMGKTCLLHYLYVIKTTMYGKWYMLMVSRSKANVFNLFIISPFTRDN
jgi:hypothetical protein